MELTFVSAIERDKDGTWWYVHVPAEVREALREHERRGFVPVTATVGATSWDGSLMPWADGSAQLTVGKRVRERESLELGREVRVSVRPR
ncbi:MAG: DUF1905 domain-containing protein [Actinobacteria bacterium]|nr:DUF1905 domain-containing protein [Actinomycetota bacterium]